MPETDQRFIIVRGNPADGYDFIGPFDDIRAALVHRDIRLQRHTDVTAPRDCWIVELRAPDDEETVEAE
jgi:hypothetical protein